MPKYRIKKKNTKPSWANYYFYYVERKFLGIWWNVLWDCDTKHFIGYDEAMEWIQEKRRGTKYKPKYTIIEQFEI